jgi:hypothetical protein
MALKRWFSVFRPEGGMRFALAIAALRVPPDTPKPGEPGKGRNIFDIDNPIDILD